MPEKKNDFLAWFRNMVLMPRLNEREVELNGRSQFWNLPLGFASSIRYYHTIQKYSTVQTVASVLELAE